MLRRAVLLLIPLLLATACQAEVEVSVRVEEDSSGAVTAAVTLDAEALHRLEGLAQLRSEDLAAAGWSLAEPLTQPDGGVRIEARKAFADPAGLGAVLAEISGAGGPYGRLGLVTEHPFARSRFRLEGVLDGSLGVSAFAEPGLAELLGGEPFGWDLAALEAELGVPLGSLVTLGLEVVLPGGALASWETTLDASAPVPVLVTSEVLRTRSLALAAAALGFAALLALLVVARLVLGLRRLRRRRLAEHAIRAAEVVRVQEASPEADEQVSEEESREPAPERALELVVVGGSGVAFGIRDEVDELVAFARSQGSSLEYPRIAQRYAEACLGRLSSSELWSTLGIEGDAVALDEEMLGRYQLTPGLRDFVARARDRGYGVAYLGDAPSAWGDHLRRSFRLEELISPWIVSAYVGARLPDTAIFEALRRSASVEPEACLFIHDRLIMLEAARGLGYGTAWFSPTGRAAEAPGHSIIRGFTELLSG